MTIPDPKLCPTCGELVEWTEPHAAEEDTNTPRWAGGYICGCGWQEEEDDYTPPLFGDE